MCEKGISAIIFHYIGEDAPWLQLSRCQVWLDLGRLQEEITSTTNLTLDERFHPQNRAAHYGILTKSLIGQKRRLLDLDRFGDSPYEKREKLCKIFQYYQDATILDKKSFLLMHSYQDAKPPLCLPSQKGGTRWSLSGRLSQTVSRALHEHQLDTLDWMMEKERNLQIGGGNFELPVDPSWMCWPGQEDKQNKVFFDVIRTQLFSSDIQFSQPPIKIALGGAILADGIGIGKTLILIALSKLRRTEEEKDSLLHGESPESTIEVHNNSSFVSRATLILSPSHLVQQWKHQIMESCALTVKVITICTTKEHAAVNYKECINADFVIVSVQLLSNPSYTSHNNTAKTLSRTHNVRVSFLALCRKADLDPMQQHSVVTVAAKALLQTRPLFEHFQWRRLILDEAHEIVQKQSYLKKDATADQLSRIPARVRWYVSATPFPSILSAIFAMHFLQLKINGVIFTDLEPCTLQEIKQIEDDSTKTSKSEFRASVLLTRLGGEISSVVHNNLFTRSTSISIAKSCGNLPSVTQKTIYYKLTDIEHYVYTNCPSDSSNTQKLETCAHPQLGSWFIPCLTEDRVLSLSSVFHQVYQASAFDFYEVQYVAGILRYNLEMYRTTLQFLQVCDTVPLDDDATQLFLLQFSYRSNNAPVLASTHEALMQLSQELNERLAAIQKKLELCDYDVNLFRGRLESLQAMQIAKTRPGALSRQVSDHTLGLHVTSSLTFIFPKIQLVERFWQLEVPVVSRHAIHDTFPVLPDIVPEIVYGPMEAITDQWGSKLCALICFLRGSCSSIAQADMVPVVRTFNRVLIFSQLPKLLSIVKSALTAENIRFALCHGNVMMRNKALREFNDSEQDMVLLLSLEDAASGSNLQKATHVVLLDPLCGTLDEVMAVEHQAIGRAHRQGQTKSVEILRFIASETIEEDLARRNFSANGP